MSSRTGPSSLHGTGILLRSHLRRDWWVIAAWSIGGAVLFWSQGVSLVGLYAHQAELDTAAASLESNAAFIAMAGPARALDTVGGQIFWQSAAFGAIVAGLMTMFLTGRHTRAEEESGRDELVRSAAIGRHAPVVAGFAVAAVASVTLGAATSGLLFTIRASGPLAGLPLPAADNLAAGVGLTACGWVFAGTALVAAQLTRSTRAMYGVAGSVIGVAYVLRAVGDVGYEALSWLSPIGWYQQMQVYSGVRWWPLAVMLAAAAANVLIATRLFERRDVGQGLFPDRVGPADASRGLAAGTAPGRATAWGLAWRLQRGSVLGWAVGLGLTGASYGAMGDSVADLIGNSDYARDAFAGGAVGDLVDGFYATAVLILALIGSGFAISSALRPRGEEAEHHLESLLATGLDRSWWLWGQTLVTVAGTVIVLAAGGLGLGAGYAATTGEGEALLRYGAPVLAFVPPVLLLAAVGRLLYGLVPRWAALAWAYLGWCVVVMILARPLQIPDALQDLSPFHHLALVPAEPMRWLPVAATAAIAVLVSGAGQIAFRRRDIG